jgi:hypothetical protein
LSANQLLVPALQLLLLLLLPVRLGPKTWHELTEHRIDSVVGEFPKLRPQTQCQQIEEL